jgi:hypothetical protein
MQGLSLKGVLGIKSVKETVRRAEDLRKGS